MALLCFVWEGAAQTSNVNIIPKRNSPYSRFGLGDLQDQSFIPSASMGGLSAAFMDPFHLNLRNPASLAFLQTTAFELGLNAKFSLLNGQETNTRNWSGNLDYMALGFPLRNPINDALERKQRPFGMGMAFGLQPYSVVGYDIRSESEGDDGAGNTVQSFKGTGGAYRLSWGNAARFKNLAVGVNLNYLFGKLTNSRRVEFPDETTAYSSEFLDEMSVNGWLLEGGAQYVLEFKELNDKGEKEPSGKRFIAGVFGSKKNRFGTNTSQYISRDNSVISDGDTIIYTDDIRQTGYLPSQLTFGLTFEDVNRLRIGGEYSIGKWSQYSNEAKPEQLTDTWGVALGAEYIPDYASYNNFFERVRYRLGAFYRTDPRSFSVGQLTQYALTMGIGMPIVRPREQPIFINAALEIGQQGSPDLIRETYFKLAFGFTLNDNTWFFKRKFN